MSATASDQMPGSAPFESDYAPQKSAKWIAFVDGRRAGEAAKVADDAPFEFDATDLEGLSDLAAFKRPLSPIDEQIDTAIAGIDIIRAYAMWCGKMTPKVGSKTESIQISCPTKEHVDSHPSAWISLEKGDGVFCCGASGAGGDKFSVAGYHFDIDPKGSDFPQLKRAMARDLGVDVHESRSGREYVVSPPRSAPVAATATTTPTRPEVVTAEPSALATENPTPEVVGYPWDELTSLLDGNYEPPDTGLLYREDGLGLFYPGKVHQVFGEDGTGKTWLSDTVAAALLQAGGIVFYLDYDDTAATHVQRLQQLGVDRVTIQRSFLHKTDPDFLDDGAVAAIAAGIPTDRPSLVVVDVAADALIAHNLSEDKAGDFLYWFAHVLLPLARAGACVLLNDHVVKTNDHGGHGRGTGAKRGKMDGVVYELTAPTPLFPGERGVLALKVHKDRYGRVGKRGELVARILFEPSGDDAYEVRVCVPSKDVPTANDAPGRTDKLGTDMEHVSDAIADAPGISFRAIRDRASLSDARARAAVAELEAAGWIAVTRGTNGSSSTHRSLIPYRRSRDPKSASFSQGECDDWRERQSLPPHPMSTAVEPQR
jgi:hypothetical protein